jgi:hypothetical protein
MPAPATPCFCPNCGDVTLDNGTPAVAATAATPAVAAVPPDARCPSCTMRVQDAGVVGSLWPTGTPTGTPSNFPVDPATGAIRLPTGVLTPPWVAAPTPIAPAGPTTPAAKSWYQTAPGIVAIVLGGVLFVLGAAWLIRGDAGDKPPVLPVSHLSSGGNPPPRFRK